ncbi:MAG TPA: hypothetical protein VGS80_23185, partial [Ktedonobacterales bacterium]|nr:hypothetical protein [Ktedonobacterales bacterium]
MCADLQDTCHPASRSGKPLRPHWRCGHVDAAFDGRHAAFLLKPEANWEDPRDDAANIRWVRACVEDTRPFSDGGRYLNFAGCQEEGDTVMRSAFGPQYGQLV